MSGNVFSMMMTKLGWLSQNSRVIAENVAKMHIPGAKAQELEEISFSDHMRKGVQTTHPKHLGYSQGPISIGQEKQNNYKVSITGNDINYQDELRRANETNAQHQQISMLYSKFSNIFRLGMK